MGGCRFAWSVRGFHGPERFPSSVPWNSSSGARATAFWRELSEANPRALLLLSWRDPESWWESVDQTILSAARHERPPDLQEWQDLFHDLLRRRFDQIDPWPDKDAAMAAYERHDQKSAVRRRPPSTDRVANR